MIQDWRTLDRPDVSYTMYYKEIIFLIIGLIVPIIFWYVSKDPEWFGASGSITVFLSVLTEFFLLHKLNVKHINNALRVKSKAENERPLRFSIPAERITIAALIVAIYGTSIWGFGKLLTE